jgi:hypothetical protein
MLRTTMHSECFKCTTQSRDLYKRSKEEACTHIKQIKINSVGSVHKRTTPAEQPPLVSEVSANFLRIEGATWSA